MDKKLRDYIKYIEKAAEKPTPELIEYHKTITAQFQHERLIHLIVTLFFALFMIIFFIFFGVMEVSLATNEWGNIVCWCIGAIAGLLLITTLLYVRHYYRLENGVQKLEDITRKLYKR